MKNFLLLTLLSFILAANPAAAQYVNLDFEAGGLGATWAWTMDQNGSNPALGFIANPVSGGMNTSATVAEFTAEVGGNPWALTYTDDMDNFMFDATNAIVTIMVYKPVISDVAVKFEIPGGANHEIKVPNSVINQWETLTFDFTAVIGETYSRLVIIPDFEARAQTNTIYFDNIQIPEGNVAPPPPAVEPTVAAPTPIHDETADNVISIFSDSYTDVAGTDFDPSWGQATNSTIEMVASNPTIKYANLNYQGTQFTPQDVSTSEFVHLDFWTSNSTALNFYLISNSGGEIAYPLTITADQWVSVEIPMSHFSTLSLTDIFQFKVDGNGDVWFDNWYFYGSTTPPVVLEPTTAAPTPTNACVTSVFSDAYTNINVADFAPNWGEATDVTTVMVESNPTLKYTGLSYQGTQFAAAEDLSSYESFHLDIWAPNGGTFEFYLISQTTGEQKYDVVSTAEQWVSVDIPLSHYTNLGMVLSDIHQFKIVGAGNVWFDNWYFHSGGVVDMPAAGTAATVTAVEQCESGTWEYYADASTPTEYAMAIDWGTGANAAAKAAATVTIDVMTAPFDMDDGSNKTWSMARYWNVDLNGQTLTDPVSIKFFYDDVEKTAIESAMNADGRATTGFKWFKTTGVNFDPATHITGEGISGGAVELTNSNTAGLTESGVAYAQFDGITSFSGGSGSAGVGMSALLPVDYNYFNAKAVNAAVVLNWETASEWNNDYFEVQSSVNGRDFTTFDMVQGAGNSDTEQAYNATDKSPANGANYYRLKQVDFDGNFEYSSIQKVNFRSDAANNIVFPNPATDKLNIIFADEAANATLQIYSLTGQLLLEYKVSEGAIQQSLDLNKLGKGVYRLNINNNGQNETHSIVLL